VRAAVSVVVPTYNRAADLARALESLRAQTVDSWEAIIVDNHSEDGTRAMVEELRDSRVRFLQVHNHGIVAHSRNVGIRAASAEYVALLDSDDWWAPRKVEESLRRLRAGADVVYHDLYLVRSARQRRFWRRVRTRPLKAPVFRDLLDNGNALATSGVVIRRELLSRTGGFSEEPQLVGWEDYDTWLRIAQLTDRFERISEPLGYYWIGGGNISTPRRLLLNLDAFREKYAEGADAPLPRLPGWFHYAAGRAQLSIGDFAAAATDLSRAIAAGLPAMLKLKASWLLCLSQVRRSWRGAGRLLPR
jgi:glycosyltransferase involved in cell wall biosynthesis